MTDVIKNTTKFNRQQGFIITKGISAISLNILEDNFLLLKYAVLENKFRTINKNSKGLTLLKKTIIAKLYT